MNFKTMLAGKADPTKLKFPMLVSPKLDGVRVHVIDGVAVSRNLLPFKNPGIQKIFGHPRFNGLDGEFMVGDPTDPAAFRMTGVLNALNADVSNVMFHVFDDFTHPKLGFYSRLDLAHGRVKGVAGFAPVDHYEAHSHDGVDTLEATFLELGYEGAMLRDPDGPYKFGRSTTNEGYLLKLKRFEDGEARILDVEERMHNANEKTLMKGGKPSRSSHKAGKVRTGMLGAYLVEDVKTGVQFSVGSGFTDAERIDLWDGANLMIGKIIKYQYFPTGSKDKPRFPTFKGFRDPGDL